MIYHSPLVQKSINVAYAAPSLPEPSTPPSFPFDMEPPPTPSSVAPANLTNLLQDVLSVMNTIMESRADVEEEDAILQELAELVVIMQEEAEMLIEVSDLVDEYCGEIESEAEIQEMEEWCLELGIGNGNSPSINRATPRVGHEREDSGVGLDEKYEDGEEFLDDKSLEEMKSPTSLNGDDASNSLGDNNSKKTRSLGDKNQNAEQQAPIVVVTPPPKSISKDVRGGQKSRGQKKEEITSGAKSSIKKKGKVKKAPPTFRDSGLGLQSPSPRGSPISRSPRWI